MIYVLHNASYTTLQEAISAKLPAGNSSISQIYGSQGRISVDAVSRELAKRRERSLVVWHLGDLPLTDEQWKLLRNENNDLSVLAISNEPGAGAYHYSSPNQRPWYGDDRLVLMADKWQTHLEALAEAAGQWSDGKSLELSCRAARVPVRPVLNDLWSAFDAAWAYGAQSLEALREAADVLRWMNGHNFDEIAEQFPDVCIGSTTEILVVDHVSPVYTPAYRRDVAGPGGLRAATRLTGTQLLGVLDQNSWPGEEGRFAEELMQRLVQRATDQPGRRVVFWHLGELPFPLGVAAPLLATPSTGVVLFTGAEDGIGNPSLGHRLTQDLEKSLSENSFPNLVGVCESLHIGTEAKTSREEEVATRVRRALNRWSKDVDLNRITLVDAFSSAGLSVLQNPNRHEQASILGYALMACYQGTDTEKAASRLNRLASKFRGSTQKSLASMAQRLAALKGPADRELMDTLRKALEAVRSFRDISHD